MKTIRVISYLCPVCCEVHVYTEQEFLAKSEGQETKLSLDEWVEMLQEFKDPYMMTSIIVPDDYESN